MINDGFALVLGSNLNILCCKIFILLMTLIKNIYKPICVIYSRYS